MSRAMALGGLLVLLALGGCGGASSSTVGSTSTVESTTVPAGTASTQPATTTSSTGTGKETGGPPSAATPMTPEATVEAALTATDPNLACGLYSKALLASAYGNAQGCAAAIRSGGSARSVKIVTSTTSGPAATVLARPSGGPSSGERLTYRLVMENGEWRLDRISSNAKVGP